MIGIVAYGAGNVGNLMRAFHRLGQDVRLMEHPELTGPVNLGNPGEVTMLQLAELVLAKIGGPSRVTHLPLPGDDPKQRQPDITLARRELGWEPSVPLSEGLDATIRHFRTLLGL